MKGNPREACLLDTLCVCVLLLGGGEDRISHSQPGRGSARKPSPSVKVCSLESREKLSSTRKTRESWNAGSKRKTTGHFICTPPMGERMPRQVQFLPLPRDHHGKYCFSMEKERWGRGRGERHTGRQRY